ncbi:MAG: ATP-binding protein, partial [Rhodospirillales bacterium]|nr:ATP-binding protein [Rhodospirillales bacterium]
TDTPVRISLSIKGKTVILSVANRHAGISEERQRLLFTPFSMPASGAERGFGLDLAIAAVISKLHGGRITCASEPDEWTRFDLRLPIA